MSSAVSWSAERHVMGVCSHSPFNSSLTYNLLFWTISGKDRGMDDECPLTGSLFITPTISLREIAENLNGYITILIWSMSSICWLQKLNRLFQRINCAKHFIQRKKQKQYIVCFSFRFKELFLYFVVLHSTFGSNFVPFL